MKNRYLDALKSSALSITPIIVIVIILSLTGLAPLDFNRGDYILLSIGLVVLIVGLAILYPFK